MTCSVVSLPGGDTAIICGRGRGRDYCGCGTEAQFLCDYIESGHVRSCSRPLCFRCTMKQGKKDLCPAHAFAPAQAELF